MPKTIGLIGGVSPEATLIYYRLLNQHARRRRGGQSSAACLFAMLDYGVMIGHYSAGRWPAFIDEVVRAAQRLKAAGADAIAITSGTTHIAADTVARETGLTVLHMLDSLAEALRARGVTRPLLTGTPFVMEDAFFRKALAERYAGTPIIPDATARARIGEIIFDELVEGRVEAASRADLDAIILRYANEGADGVILGCTELCMILGDGAAPGAGGLPVFSTTHIHAAAIDAFLND